VVFPPVQPERLSAGDLSSLVAFEWRYSSRSTFFEMLARLYHSGEVGQVELVGPGAVV
jgi:hypothetical protein